MIICVFFKTMLGLDAEASLVNEEQRRLREKIASVNMQQQRLKEEDARLSELSLQLEQDRLKVRSYVQSATSI